MNGQLVDGIPGQDAAEVLELLQDLQRKVVSLRQEVADQRICSQCGAVFTPTDTEDSEQLEIEVRPYRRRIRRRRYQRTCACKAGSRTLIAPPAPTLIPKGCLGISV